jgi:hypothetical protein
MNPSPVMTSIIRARTLGLAASIAAISGCGASAAAPADNPIPTITTVSPTPLVAGTGAISVALTGGGFRTATRARWNGQDRATTIRNSSSLVMELTASDVSVLAVGTGRITVANPAPGGGVSDPFSIAVVYPVPVISSLSPSVANGGVAGVELFVNGAGFAPSAMIRWNSTQVVTEFISPNQLRTVILRSNFPAAGAYQVTVTNPTPGGGTSSPATFTIQTF